MFSKSATNLIYIIWDNVDKQLWQVKCFYYFSWWWWENWNFGVGQSSQLHIILHHITLKYIISHYIISQKRRKRWWWRFLGSNFFCFWCVGRWQYDRYDMEDLSCQAFSRLSISCNTIKFNFVVLDKHPKRYHNSHISSSLLSIN